MIKITALLLFLVTLTLLFQSRLVHSGGKIDFLEIDDDIVSFSTTETKTHTLPACVESDKGNLWSVSLATESGRAVYSLALTSMAKGEEVELSVDSAQDCDAVAGLERVKKVNIVMNQSQTGSQGNINIYQGDGVTLVGTFIEQSISSGKSIWYYLDPSSPKSLKILAYNSFYDWETFLFTEPDCSGETLLDYDDRNFGYIKGYEDIFYKMDDSYSTVVITSSQNPFSGVCTNTEPTSTRSYKLIETEHSVCGIGPCILRAE